MIANKFLKAILLTMSVSGLIACGGGSGDDVAGIGGTGITASGSITGFGSIFVNGVKYETNSASFEVDGNTTAIEDDLKLGMVVKVSGQLNPDGITGIADSVTYQDSLQGPIDYPVGGQPAGLDGLAVQLEILGVTVIADKTSTIYQGIAYSDLLTSPGVYIEVSGFFDALGVLYATRIENKAASTNIEIKGTASYPGTGTVMKLDVDGDSTSDFDVILLTVPAGLDGAFVEVTGTLSLSLPDTIDAIGIEFEDDLFADNEAYVSLEGIITAFTSNSSFSVSGQLVDASNATFEPAGANLALGMEVEVEGPRIGAVIFADEVEAESAEVKVAASVSAVDSGAGTITVSYVGGSLVINVDNETIFEDEFGSFDPYTLTDITSSDFIELAALWDGSDVIAKEVKRVGLATTPEDELLQGPVTSCNDGTPGSIDILGVSFSLQDGTTEYFDELENVIPDNTDFCNAANASSYFVKIKDEATANGTADEAELED
ncbi:MAG: DUF5666 domain-containing protein [Gammaproteobacteria bacterium]|nr:DUF5666 domain-containing protein [Gammaproteobacteria bacterium]